MLPPTYPAAAFAATLISAPPLSYTSFLILPELYSLLPAPLLVWMFTKSLLGYYADTGGVVDSPVSTVLELVPVPLGISPSFTQWEIVISWSKPPKK